MSMENAPNITSETPNKQPRNRIVLVALTSVAVIVLVLLVWMFVSSQADKEREAERQRDIEAYVEQLESLNSEPVEPEEAGQEGGVPLE